MTATLPDGVTLRAEAGGEADDLGTLVTEAFGTRVVADLIESLRADDAWIDGLSLVAEREGALVGQIIFTRSLLDAPRRLVDVLVLSPLAVLPAYQGQGIGSALVRYGLQQVGDRPEPLVFLEGAPGYYRRFGFAPGRPLGLRRPSLRIPEDAFQVMKLPSYDPWMTGTLVYAGPWWRHDCVGLRGADAGAAEGSDPEGDLAT